MDENKLHQKMDEAIKEKVDQVLDFTQFRTIDTPTDAYMPVNRKFVTMNGVTASRPASSILGQFYFDTTIGRPIWWNGSAWIKADGTAV